MASSKRGRSRGGGTTKKTNERKQEFIWSDDESELLLSITHEYSQAVAEGNRLGECEIEIRRHSSLIQEGALRSC